MLSIKEMGALIYATYDLKHPDYDVRWLEENMKRLYNQVRKGKEMNETTELVQKWDGKDGTPKATLERILTPEEVKARAEKKARKEQARKELEARNRGQDGPTSL